jgi:hypothetical protein
VAARRADFERALGALLALDLDEVGARAARLGRPRPRWGKDGEAPEMVEQGDQIGRGDDLDVARPGGLGALGGRADEAEAERRGVHRGEQHSGGRADPPVQAELPHRDIGGQGLGIDRPHGGEQGERDRQVVMRAFLGKVGRRQIDRDPARRQAEPDRRECGVDPLPALRHRLVGKPDQEEFAKAARNLGLDFDGARLQPEKRHRGDIGDHATSHRPVQPFRWVAGG